MSLLAYHHVQLALPAGGEERARAFYAGVLGLVEIPKPEPLAARGGVWFRGPSAADREPDRHAGLELHLGVEPDFRAARKAHPGFLVSDLAALRALLAAAGAPVHDSAPLPGLERFHTEDPFGNRLEFLARLAPQPGADAPSSPAPG